MVSSHRASGNSQTGTSSRGQMPWNRGADVDLPERIARCCEQAVDVGLDGEIRPRDPRAAELVGQCSRALFPSVEMDENACSFRGECAGARRADSA